MKLLKFGFFLCATIVAMGGAAQSALASSCNGGSTLSGGYGVLVQGAAANGNGGRFLVGALKFDGKCGITGSVVGGISGAFSGNTVSGSYNTNSDQTISVTLNLAGQLSPLTFAVGYSRTASEAVGVETDGSAIASIDLQAQNYGKTYDTSKLHGTFAVSCLNAPGFSDLNYEHFDGNGGSSGIDAYNDGGALGHSPYQQVYSVNPDGTFQVTLTTSGFTVFAAYGVIDNANNEIQYIYTLNGSGPVLGCTGKQ